jgi:tetratricopeptide (TPR) repeat protein
MTLSSYREAGGVSGAIAKTAETIFQQRLTAEQQLVARTIFVRLTELGADGGSDVPDTRRPVQFSELITRATDVMMLDAVLGILTDARLVTTDVTPTGDAKVVEIAHEALIREWPTLRQWLDQNRETLLRQRQLTNDVNDWLKLERDPGVLYRGARLEQALSWSAGSAEPLSLLEQEFLAASRIAAEEEARKAARLARAARVQRILAAVSVLLLAAVVFVALYAAGVFNPPPEPDQMDGDFNIAIAEFAILDENGTLVNDNNQAGLALAGRVAQNLVGEFGDNPEILVWNDGPELLEQHNATIGIVVDEDVPGDAAPGEAEGIETPEVAAERLNADIIVYGLVEPEGDFSLQTLKFYLRPQFGADFTNMVGNYAFQNEIQGFDITRPREEVWRELDPLARALAWLTYGLRQETLGEPQAALEAFERAATFAPNSDIVHYFTGQEYIFLAQAGGEVGEARDAHIAAAESALQEALRLNPANARAQIGLGSVHFLGAQQLYIEITAEAFEGDRAAGYAAVQEAAQRALQTYGVVAELPEQLEEYGVPVNSITRLGQGATLRLLADVGYRAGDPEAARRYLDEAKATLEAAVAPLEEARDYRLLAHLYQTLGTVYQLEGFLLAVEGSAATAIEANRQALAYYEQCIALEGNFPFDTFMRERIINNFCRPYAEQVQALLEGGS